MYDRNGTNEQGTTSVEYKEMGFIEHGIQGELRLGQSIHRDRDDIGHEAGND